MKDILRWWCGKYLLSLADHSSYFSYTASVLEHVEFDKSPTTGFSCHSVNGVSCVLSFLTLAFQLFSFAHSRTIR